MILNSLQYLRALAALSVVLFHYRATFISAGGSPEIAALVDWGHGGVPIFFVLAGFIMVWTTRLDAPPGVFLRRRIIRIYGGYLPIAIVFLIFKFSTTGVDHWIPSGLNLAGSLTLTEANAEKLLIFPSWSLTFELMFYAAFALCLSFGRKYFFTAAVVVSLVIYSIGTWLPLSKSAVFLLTSPLNLLFALGIGVGWIAICVKRIDGRLLVVLSIISFLCLSYGFATGSSQIPVQRLLGFGLGSSALILVLVELERRQLVPNWSFLCRLGDASYAIYLLHVPVAFVFATLHFNSWLAWRGGPYTLLSVYLGVVLAAGVAYFLFVERPINKFSRLVPRADLPLQ